MASPGETSDDPLDLQSLDADSIFAALTAVERAIPNLLLSVKPILAHLTAPAPGSTLLDDGTARAGELDDEERSRRASEGVDNYLVTLEKIQYVLRQTVYYLRETKASPMTLRPPPANAIPTPFASTLPASTPSQADDATGEKAELGLYASRLELRSLEDMLETLRKLREELGGEAMTVDT